jgi:hypothetical protein
MNEGLKQYAVYENYPNNKAVGHSTACSSFKVHGGKEPKTGNWKLYATKQEVETAGKATGRPFHWCPLCT